MGDGDAARVGGRVAWFQCFAGASGDMMLGALVDAGAPLESIQRAVDGLGVGQVALSVEPVMRQGLRATRITIDLPRRTAPRTWRTIRHMLVGADLPERVRSRALDVFARLARAEAAIHDTTPDEVHFHEVGALDAIVDVVGACTALEELGIATAVGSSIALGSGLTRAAHGLLPVPARAVLALLAEVGAPVYGGPAPYEMCTPTGAALLAATCQSWGGLPPMRAIAHGFGAGERDPEEVPNALRVVIGEPNEAPTDADGPTAVLLEANVDDLDPRLWPPILSRLMAAGAHDAWLTPILMKKGRPAHTLSVLLPPEVARAGCRIIFTETSTIGLRETRVDRRVLGRHVRRVVVDGHEVRVKIALLDGAVVNAQPEYEDVVSAAERSGRPVKAVLAAANAAAYELAYAPA
ncbi:MAG TPA: nickel pincer cofactor biosynthesis protein LarC [Pseudonocardiaceae bacterium]